jgi:hypothetical protein
LDWFSFFKVPESSFTSTSSFGAGNSYFLPLLLVPQPHPVTTLSRRRQQRFHDKVRLVQMANRTVRCLNFLSTGNVPEPSKPTPRIHWFLQLSTIAAMLIHILDSAWATCRHLKGDAAVPIDPRVGSNTDCTWNYQLTGDSTFIDQVIHPRNEVCNPDSESTLIANIPELGMGVGRRIPLNADRLSLPEIGQSGTVVLENVLPQLLRDLYCQPSSQLLRDPQPTIEQLARFPVSLACSAEEYRRVLHRMDESGLISWHSSPPICTNGLFAVSKDEKSDRLILDGRRCNLFFETPQKVLLSSPADFAELLLDPGAQLYVGKADVSNMFYRFKVPGWLEPYFGLPPATTSAGQQMWPCLQVLPMGFSHSVLLAQSVHLSILEHSLPQTCPNITSLRPVRLGEAFFEYIDDHGILSTSADVGTKLFGNTLESLSALGLPEKQSKTAWPKSNVADDCLGMCLRREGQILPAKSHIQRLLRESSVLISTDTASSRSVASVVGRWIWVLLLNRPLLSILSATTFDFIQANHSRSSIPDETKWEISALCDLLPLLVVNIKIPPARQALATDASLHGAGVVRRPVSDNEWFELAVSRERRGWYTRMAVVNEGQEKSILDDVTETSMDIREGRIVADQVLQFARSAEWQVQVSAPWKHEDHINILEAHALQLGIRNFLESSSNTNSRPLILLDSTAVLGAVAKGRSASVRLNHQVRRLAALLCAGNLRPAWVWVPTDDNPADMPSRAFKSPHELVP